METKGIKSRKIKNSKMEAIIMRIKDISLNNLKRRKAKAFFLIVGLTVGITTVVSLVSITRIMTEDIANKLDEFGANIIITPRSDDLTISYGGINLGGVSIDGNSLKIQDLPKILEIDVRENISTVSPKLIGVIELEGKKIPIIGVRFQDEIRLKKWWKIHGNLPKSQDEILVGNEVATRLFKSTNDFLALDGKKLKISGILEETGSQDDFMIFSDLSLVQKVLKKPEALSFIEVSAYCNTCPIEEIVKQISAKLPHAKVTAIKQTIETKMEAMHRFKKFSIGISIIVLLIGSLIIFTNMMASVNERKREIGIFRAIGFRKSHIVKIIFLEALIVSFLAGIIGYLFGLGVSHMIAPAITGIKVQKIYIEPYLGIFAITLSCLIGILSSSYPAIKAANMDPTTALRAL